MQRPRPPWVHGGVGCGGVAANRAQLVVLAPHPKWQRRLCRHLCAWVKGGHACLLSLKVVRAAGAWAEGVCFTLGRVRPPPSPTHSAVSGCACQQGLFEGPHQGAVGQGGLSPHWCQRVPVRGPHFERVREGATAQGLPSGACHRVFPLRPLPCLRCDRSARARTGAVCATPVALYPVLHAVAVAPRRAVYRCHAACRCALQWRGWRVRGGGAPADAHAQGVWSAQTVPAGCGSCPCSAPSPPAAAAFVFPEPLCCSSPCPAPPPLSPRSLPPSLPRSTAHKRSTSLPLCLCCRASPCTPWCTCLRGHCRWAWTSPLTWRCGGLWPATASTAVNA
jgi:hypothetical protein